MAASRGIFEVKVFGSMARGDADDSGDVDLLVSLPEGFRGLALGGLLMDVQELLGDALMCLRKTAYIRRFVIKLSKKQCNCGE